jgi:hypothetical protein
MRLLEVDHISIWNLLIRCGVHGFRHLMSLLLVSEDIVDVGVTLIHKLRFLQADTYKSSWLV